MSYLCLSSHCPLIVSPIPLKTKKPQKSFAIPFLCINFAAQKQNLGLSLALWCERKVRAAQGTPLPKIEAIGDSRR